MVDIRGPLAAYKMRSEVRFHAENGGRRRLTEGRDRAACVWACMWGLRALVCSLRVGVGLHVVYGAHEPSHVSLFYSTPVIRCTRVASSTDLSSTSP
jgi:hypothetical protein